MISQWRNAEKLLAIHRARLLLPLALTAAVRILGSSWLFQTLTGRFGTPWMSANPNLIPAGWSWLWLFNAFDSLHFTLIAAHGYSQPEYAYFPGFPILIFLAGRLVGNYWFGSFLVTQAFAFGSVVMFQLVAEQYLPWREALHATLLMAVFPFLSVFTTLGYSEPIFLFATLSTWYFYVKERIGSASLIAGFAATTRGYGIVIVLPMLVGLIESKRYSKLAYVTVPFLFLGSWLLFCYFSTGDALASWSDQKFWQVGGIGDGIKVAQTLLHHGLRGLINSYYGLDPTIFWALALFAILIALTWEVDRLLFVYAAGLAGLLLAATTYNLSLLRFLPFIFPIWLTLRIKNSTVVAICICVLAPMTIVVWLYTIAVTFVG